MTTLADYEKKAKSKANRAAWLGEVVIWHTSMDGPVMHSKLKKILTENGLDSFVPREPRDEDVFRRCAPNGHRKKITTTNGAIDVNYMIRQVSRGGGSCTKHIVAEYVDSFNEVLDYEDVYRLEFDGNDLVHGSLGAGDATAEEIAREIVATFHKTRGRVDAAAVRAVIRNVLDSARSIALRPNGGVYFVMASHAHLVDAIERATEDLPGAHVRALPLIDDEKQRDLVRRAYEAETIEEADRLLEEISGILKSDTVVTADFYARTAQKFSGLTEKNEEYMHLLEDTLGSAGSKLTILRKQMTALLKRMEA